MRALTMAVLVGVVGAVLAAGAGMGVVAAVDLRFWGWAGIALTVTALTALLTIVVVRRLIADAYASVLLEDAGLTVGNRRTERRIAWTAIARIRFRSDYD